MLLLYSIYHYTSYTDIQHEITFPSFWTTNKEFSTTKIISSNNWLPYYITAMPSMQGQPKAYYNVNTLFDTEKCLA